MTIITGREKQELIEEEVLEEKMGEKYTYCYLAILLRKKLI